MFIGYGALSGVEVWNNQRVLDYLAGDPDSGVAGMASPYTTVRRRSSPSSATSLFCDPPIAAGEFVVEVAALGGLDAEDPNGYMIGRGVTGSTLLGEHVDVEFINDGAVHQVKRYYFTFAEAGGPRPAVPDPLDPGWVDIGYPAVPTTGDGDLLTTTPDPCADTDVVPFYEHWVMRPENGTETVECWIYIDHCLAASGLPGIGVSSDSTLAGDWPVAATLTVYAEGPDPHGRYSTPIQDDAPWYDSAVPESADFAGLYVEEITGFDSLVSRDVNEGALMGGTLGPLTMKVRPLTVTGWLRAATCCAAEYGLHWLTEALAGTEACDGCSVGDLFMLKCAPPTNEHDPEPLDYIRLMHHVGLVDGPKVVERAGTCCSDCGSTSLKVQFTLTSEIPYVFSDVEWVLYDDPFTEGPFAYDLSLPCTREERCGGDEEDWSGDCGPQLPPAPPPYRISDECYCEPWETMRVGVEFNNTRQWNSATTYIEIKAGQSDVRNVKLVAFHNPQGEDCPMHYEVDDRWMCTIPCASIAISRVPAGGRLIIDSRNRSVNLIKPGGESVSGLRFVSTGDDSGPFDWFDIGHCSRICLVASVEESVSDDATISVGVVNRYLASGG